MTSARFLIFGANRETGRPTSLVLEASSREEAEAFALEQGVLIQQVQELPSAAAKLREAEGGGARPERAAPLHAAPDRGAPERDARDVGAPAILPPRVARPEVREVAPQVVPARERETSVERRLERAGLRLPWPRGFEALAGEGVIATYEPRGLELGVLGALMGRRAKVVLTTHRLIISERRLFGGSVQTAQLESLSGMVLGSRISTWLMAMGLAGLLLTMMQMAGASLSASSVGNSLGGALGGLGQDAEGSGGMLGSIQGLLSGAKSGMMAFAVLQGVASVAMMVFAWSKELAGISAGGRIGLRARMMNTGRAAAFVRSAEEAISAVRKERA